MERLLVVVLLVSLLLAGCERGNSSEDAEADDPDFVPTPTLDTANDEGFQLPSFGSDENDEPDPQSDRLEGQFNNLRFATSGDGSPQEHFPYGTTDIYALWDYDGMRPDDVMKRLWYHNGELYLEREEEWDFLTYGFSGTVRDVYHYNYADNSVFPGNWRVELYLNGELEVAGEFTVAHP